MIIIKIIAGIIAVVGSIFYGIILMGLIIEWVEAWLESRKEKQQFEIDIKITMEQVDDLVLRVADVERILKEHTDKGRD